MDPTILFIVLMILIMCSAFYAASEIAIVSLPEIDVESLRKKSKKVGQRLDYHRKNAQRFVINISIANNFINILASSLATATMIALFPKYGVLIATVGMTFLILLFGEIIPKIMAITHTKKIAEKSATILWISSKILSPLIWIFTQIVKLIAKNDQEEDKVTPDALKYYVRKSYESGSIDSHEKEYIKNVLDLDSIPVKRIITPKKRVFSLDIKLNVREAQEKFIESGFSRAPVYNGEKNNIIGIICLKDIILKDEKVNISEFIQKPKFIHNIKKADEVLLDFQKNSTHLSIVITPEGDYEGIITLEDILEEIVGEIYDETDKRKKFVTKINKNTYEILGNYKLIDFNKEFNTEFENQFSIGGFLIDHLNKIPKKDEEIVIEKYKFIILEVNEVRIQKIKFIISK